MSTTLEDVTGFFERVNEHPDAANAWASAGAIVRIVVTDPDVTVTLGRKGELTAEDPTHVLTIAWPDLEDIILGRRSFLRSVTGRRLTMTGPVLQSLAIGQVLPTLSALSR